MGFSGIFGHISQFLNSFDFVIFWFESGTCHFESCYQKMIATLFFYAFLLNNIVKLFQKTL